MTSSGAEKQIYKFDSPQFKSLFTTELNLLADIFKKNGFEIRIAGGAVRDLLLGLMPSDVDFATTATPKEMVAMFESEQVRMINNKGERHGTVTCRLNNKENFEITTLRVDIETDGRHANVEFTKNWMLDAERRDLTINSMFLGFDGTLYDYFNGKQDLMNRRVKFVGKTDDRIKEDYLRILRYFRFFGRIAENPLNHDADTLKSIKENASGLSIISGERLWVEMKKILTGNFVDEIMKTMNELDVLQYLGIDGNLNFDELSKIWNECRILNPSPMTILSSLFYNEDQLQKLHARMKLSKDELQLGQFMLEQRSAWKLLNIEESKPDYSQYANAAGESKESKKFKLESTRNGTNSMEKAEGKVLLEGELLETKDAKNEPRHFQLNEVLYKCQDLLIEEQSNIYKTKSKILELLKYLNLPEALEQFEKWNPPKFPVSGIRLIEMGVPKGPQFSKELNRLKDIWKHSRFTKTEDELLQHVKFKKKVSE